MKKILRWLGFHVHEWGPWEQNYEWSKTTGMNVFFSVRTCSGCGKEQRGPL